MHTVLVDDRGFVAIDDVRIPEHFTWKETATLRSILSRKTITTKEMLLNDLYAGRDEPELKIVDVFVCKVRRKLGEHHPMIETVWGRGYAPGADYEPAAGIDGGMIIELGPQLAKRLDEAAFEGDMTPSQLANLLLVDAVRTYRNTLWAA